MLLSVPLLMPSWTSFLVEACFQPIAQSEVQSKRDPIAILEPTDRVVNSAIEVFTRRLTCRFSTDQHPQPGVV